MKTFRLVLNIIITLLMLPVIIIGFFKPICWILIEYGEDKAEDFINWLNKE